MIAQLPKPVEDALRIILAGPARKFSAAFAVIAARMINGQSKSIEERLIDYVVGASEAESRREIAQRQLLAWFNDPAAEQQRRLAADAIKNIPADRLLLPAPQIAGPIFRNSEFEPEGTPIWEMWAQLLSKASDSKHADEAHPAYPHIILQLSYDEAVILGRAKAADDQPFLSLYSVVRDFLVMSEESQGHVQLVEGLLFPAKLALYLNHLRQLGLIDFKQIGTPEDLGAEVFGVHHKKHQGWFLSFVGRDFMNAVSSKCDSDQSS